MKKIPQKKPKAIIFDIDKTLREQNTWYEFTEKLGGTANQHASIYTQLISGQISMEETRKQVLEMWTANGPVSRKKVKEVIDSIHLRGEAVSLINELQAKGFTICLISGLLNDFVTVFAQRYSIKYHYGNGELVFDKNNLLVDYLYDPQQAKNKTQLLDKFLQVASLQEDECIAIGDSYNDALLFQRVPGIAVHPETEHIGELAWKQVKYLPRVMQLIESIE